MTSARRFSVVIPAKDEARVIGRCLAFMSELDDGEAHVVVAANGCSDDTVERARQVRGVTVLDLPSVGKPGALNAGDEAVEAFPRIYLDADIVTSGSTLRYLADALSADPAAAVAAPRPVFVTSGRPYSVRLFFAAYERLPYVSNGLVGLGVYALNAAGRARFGVFPPLTADDLYVQRLFQPDEMRILSTSTFEIQTPHTLRDLVKVRTRTARGNAELAATTGSSGDRSSGRTAGALARMVTHDPKMIPAVVVYVVVTVVARLRARRSTTVWQRDESTR